MFRGELGGKINEDFKDGRKKPVDSSGYKKPEILEEKNIDESVLEKIKDISFLREIISKTLKRKKENQISEVEKQREGVKDEKNIEEQINELNLKIPKNIQEHGTIYCSEISKQKPIIYLGKKFAGMQV